MTSPTDSEVVKRLEESVINLRKSTTELRAELVSADASLSTAEKYLALARQRLEQEPQGAEKYVKESDQGFYTLVGRDGAALSSYLYGNLYKRVLAWGNEIISAERQAQDQQTTERIAKAVEDQIGISHACNGNQIAEFIRQGCPQPKDAESPKRILEVNKDGTFRAIDDPRSASAQPQRMTAREIAGKIVRIEGNKVNFHHPANGGTFAFTVEHDLRANCLGRFALEYVAAAAGIELKIVEMQEGESLAKKEGGLPV